MEVTIMTYLQKAYKAIFISSIIVFSAITSEAQAGWNQPAGQFLINAIRISGYLFFCGEPVPLNIPDVKERLEKNCSYLLITAIMLFYGLNAPTVISRILKSFKKQLPAR